MKKSIHNWFVRCYDDNNNVIDSFIIQDRTKYEANKEAESDPRFYLVMTGQ